VRTALIQGSDNLLELDISFQSTLCYAVKAGCASDILDLLLEARADVNGTNCAGLSALAVLGAMPLHRLPGTCPHDDLLSKIGEGISCSIEELGVDQAASAAHEAAAASRLGVASHLLARGADPTILDFRGALPSQHALSSGRGELACLLEHHSDVQGCAVLCQISQQRGIRQDLVFQVGQYLVPKHVWGRLATVGPFPRYAISAAGSCSELAERSRQFQ